MTKYSVKMEDKELYELQRADYELSGVQVLMREFAGDSTIFETLLPKYQEANAALKQAQLSIFKNHEEIPFDAYLNFDFRNGTAYWEE